MKGQEAVLLREATGEVTGEDIGGEETGEKRPQYLLPLFLCKLAIVLLSVSEYNNR